MLDKPGFLCQDGDKVSVDDGGRAGLGSGGGWGGTDLHPERMLACQDRHFNCLLLPHRSVSRWLGGLGVE